MVLLPQCFIKYFISSQITHNSFLTHTKGKYPDFWALTEGYAYGTALQQVGLRQDSATILEQKEIVLDETDMAETICKKSLKETALKHQLMFLLKY